jgi:hypothetical protein
LELDVQSFFLVLHPLNITRKLTNSNENADENSGGTFLLAIANENGDIIKKIKKLYWQFH